MNAEGTSYLIFQRNEHRPAYVDDNLEELELSENNPLPKAPDFLTIYISGGKKNKLNKSRYCSAFSRKKAN